MIVPSGSSATSRDVVVTNATWGLSLRISKSTIRDVFGVGGPPLPAAKVVGSWFVIAASVTVQFRIPDARDRGRTPASGTTIVATGAADESASRAAAGANLDGAAEGDAVAPGVGPSGGRSAPPADVPHAVTTRIVARARIAGMGLRDIDHLQVVIGD